MWAFSASVGFILRPRLNGVLMALEGGGSGKVRVPFPEGEIGEKMRGGRTGGGTKWRDNFEKLEGQNSCPSIPCEGGATSQKTE